MGTRLIYLLEEDFKHDLAEVLSQENLAGQNVIFFVELRKVDEQLVPMIADFSKLRLKKAEKRFRDWIKKNIKGLENFQVMVFDGRPSRSNPNFDLTKLDKSDFHVLVTPKNESRLTSYLKYNTGIHQIRYLSLGDFNDEDINSL